MSKAEDATKPDPEMGGVVAGVEKAAAAAAAAAVGKKKVAEEEDPRLRWAFVRKVYCILAIQFAVTAAIAVVAWAVRPIPRFFATGSLASWLVYLAILLSPLFVLWPMLKYRERHPVNLILLGLFTLCESLGIAVCSSTFFGKVVLQAAILTAVAVIGLTLFTFWAADKGYDFSFMVPFLAASLLVLLAYLIIQICFPLGRASMTMYGCFATVVFSAFIVFDTHQLIKRHTYNEYVVAAISLYLDVINLFMAQLSEKACRAGDSGPSTRTSWSSTPPEAAAGRGDAAAPDFLTVKEKGAGGAVPGRDPLYTLIPRPEQSDPSEPTVTGEKKIQEVSLRRFRKPSRQAQRWVKSDVLSQLPPSPQYWRRQAASILVP
uniref:Uncharacterized protein n=1 Tax=Leersia perrieri TaxID=77586 RepID=A0A0D9XTL7_9ORYZ